MNIFKDKPKKNSEVQVPISPPPPVSELPQLNVFMDESGRFYKAEKALRPADALLPVVEESFKNACTSTPQTREQIIAKIQGGSSNA